MAVSNDTLRDLGKQYVAFAHQHAISKLDAQLELDGEKLRIQYEKKTIKPEFDDQDPTYEESVMIKRGSINHPKVVFAAPVDWL